MRSTISCAVLSLLCGVSLSVASAQTTSTRTQPVYRQSKASTELRVNDLVRRMTIEEKIQQLDLYNGARDLMNKKIDDTHATTDAVLRDDIATKYFGATGVGGIHDLHPTPQQANDIQEWVILHSRLGIPVLFVEEALHGYDNGTVYPAPINLAATWDPQVAQKTAAGIAAEARAHSVGMILAPVLDLARDPRWGRIEEDFGEDSYLTGKMGLAFVRGAQGENLWTNHSVVAEPKHFAGHGSPEGGTNTSPVHIGERELRMTMLKSFEPAFREGHAMATMAGYHEIDGIPITADPYLLKNILRGEWGFKGFVLSDLGAIERLYSAHHVAATKAETACIAIRSGVNMQFYDLSHEEFQNALKDCVSKGTLSMSDLNEAVRGVLRVKFELGLFDHPMIDTALNNLVFRSSEHLYTSLRSARESMTLLKNDGHLLPLSKSIGHIALIGPNANVARYGDYEEEANGLHISMLDGLRKELPAAKIDFNDGKEIDAAVALAKQAEVVVLGLGEWQGISGEGHDRSSLDLPGNQEQLLEAVVATGKPVVLVLQNGRPLTIGWAKEHVSAILEAWYPGEYGGQAIAEALLGEINPSGRLTITFPRSLGQLPVYYNADPSRRRQYIDDDGEPLFPFGFGLSYTTFRYGHLAVQPPATLHGDVRVSVDVTNAGDVGGAEVAQLYVGQDTSSVEIPRRSLKGFSRIYLAPKETKTVTFAVPQSDLALWNAARKWVTEPGSYTVWVGGSSLADLSAKFTLR